MSEARLIRCGSCGATNRVPQSRMDQGLQPVCGKCKTPLSMREKPWTVTDASFSSDVDQSPLPVLVDLWAEWCGPCRAIAPILDELAAEMSGKVRIAKLNIDENPITTERFRISSIPALLVMKGGKEMDRIVGVRPKSEIRQRLQPYLT
jgi:thioredoxin 2